MKRAPCRFFPPLPAKVDHPDGNCPCFASGQNPKNVSRRFPAKTQEPCCRCCALRALDTQARGRLERPMLRANQPPTANTNRCPMASRRSPQISQPCPVFSSASFLRLARAHPPPRTSFDFGNPGVRSGPASGPLRVRFGSGLGPVFAVSDFPNSMHIQQ